MELKEAEAGLRRAMRSRPKRILCVDLDGTLAEYNGWHGFTAIGKPIPAVVDMVRREAASGSYIIIHTCRVTTIDNRVIHQAVGAIEKWLRKNKIPHDDIWSTVGKPYGAWYVDDKAVNPACENCMGLISGKKNKV
jgi:hypothetical protein